MSKAESYQIDRYLAREKGGSTAKAEINVEKLVPQTGKMK
jgi:hypothetical protein